MLDDEIVNNAAMKFENGWNFLNDNVAK